jgi:hypothetical protein
MTRLTILLIYMQFLQLCHEHQGRVPGKCCTINGKMFIRNPDGSVMIIPEDGSYIRILDRHWYDNKTL